MQDLENDKTDHFCAIRETATFTTTAAHFPYNAAPWIRRIYREHPAAAGSVCSKDGLKEDSSTGNSSTGNSSSSTGNSSSSTGNCSTGNSSTGNSNCSTGNCSTGNSNCSTGNSNNNYSTLLYRTYLLCIDMNSPKSGLLDPVWKGDPWEMNDRLTPMSTSVVHRQLSHHSFGLFLLTNQGGRIHFPPSYHPS